MSENNYGNNQGNAQNPYAAQQPNSSAQSSYGQDYGQAPAAQNTYGQDYGQSASAQNSYGQTQQQNATPQNSAQQNQYGQFGAQPSSQNAYGQNVAQGTSAQGAATQNTYGQAQPAQQQYGYGQDASYQGQPAQQNQYGYGQEASYQAQPADYNYQQNSYQQPQQDAYGYGQPAGYPYAAPIVKKAPGLALAAMILGIVGVVTGFFVFGALLGIAAIVLGVLSLKKVKEAGAGKGFAITGIVTGAVAILFSLCMLFVYISVAQTAEKCLEVGTEDGHGNVVCQIGDNPNNRMTVPAHR